MLGRKLFGFVAGLSALAALSMTSPAAADVPQKLVHPLDPRRSAGVKPRQQPPQVEQEDPVVAQKRQPARPRFARIAGEKRSNLRPRNILDPHYQLGAEAELPSPARADDASGHVAHAAVAQSEQQAPPPPTGRPASQL